MAKNLMTNRKIAAQKTKEKIYNSALSLFKKRGYSNVTVEDITNNADVAKGTFYIHFKSKDDVLVRAFEEADKHYLAAMESACDISSGDQLIMLGNVMCRYVSESFGLDFTKILYQSQISLAERPMLLANSERALYRLLRAIIKKGKESNEFRRDLSEEEMELLFAHHMRSLLYDWCMFDGKFDLIEEGSRYFKLVLRTFSNPDK